MSPRLGVLNNIPFTTPFEVRVSIFRHFVATGELWIKSAQQEVEDEGVSGDWQRSTGRESESPVAHVFGTTNLFVQGWN